MALTVRVPIGRPQPAPQIPNHFGLTKATGHCATPRLVTFAMRSVRASNRLSDVLTTERGRGNQRDLNSLHGARDVWIHCRDSESGCLLRQPWSITDDQWHWIGNAKNTTSTGARVRQVGCVWLRGFLDWHILREGRFCKKQSPPSGRCLSRVLNQNRSLCCFQLHPSLNNLSELCE